MKMVQVGRRLLLVGVAASVLASCGGADDIASPGEGTLVGVTPPPTGGGGGGTPTPTAGTPAAACPSGTGAALTDQGTSGAFRLCRLPASISADVVLPRVANLAYVIDGRVDVGTDVGGANTPNSTGRSATMTVNPGVIFVARSGDSTNDLLVVNRGSRLNAVGTAAQPIIFTALENTTGAATDTSQGLWGGVILAGRAPLSDCQAAVSTSNIGGNAGCARVVEGTGNVAGGGEVANDSSGELRYVQIRYSGVAISEGNELQGLTTQGVGRGTTISHVQIHNSADDGVEIFGGTHNARYLVVTGADDDDLDTDFGYDGSIQFVLGIKRAGNGSPDSTNLEVDSNNNREAAPRQFLRLANFTFFSDKNFPSLHIRGGADARLANGLVRNTTGACLRISHTETLRAAGSAAPDPASGVVAPDRGPPRFDAVSLECPTAFSAGNDTTATDVQNAFSLGTLNVLAATSLLTSVFQPGTGATGATAFNASTFNASGESFLVSTSFVGAVSASNLGEFQGWTCSSGFVTFGGASSSCTTLPTV